MSGRGEKDGLAEILLEFHQIGNAVKVTAIDPETLVEVSIVGDAAVGEEMLKRNVIRKLRYVLERRRSKDRPPAPKYDDYV
ncbi:DUF6898 family protein [Rhodospirillaceae bacterium SYSU D60014]|uniref:DUF6898 family protein n=1 Tax=Virgifigura deserti TaxID=2268457 RepID=UPI000E674424